MASIIVVLVLLALTGEPVANALCVTWCESSSERQICEEAIARPAVPGRSIAAAPCVVSVTIAPFLREEERRASRIATVIDIPPAFAGIPDGGGHPGFRSAHKATDGRPVPVLVLRV